MAYLLFFITISTLTTITISSASSSSPPPYNHPFSTFEPILKSLGFHHISTALPSLYADPSFSGPSTIFAPSDSSLTTCESCSLPLLLQEHIVPGLFSSHYLRKLAFGTKIETLIANRCLTITSDFNHTKLFVGGVEITHPDLFNNGVVVVHGIQGFLSHLSPFSCSVERMTSLSFPTPPSRSSLMRQMINDAMLRLRISGFSVMALAMRVKYADLANLQNMTVFALDDASIFSGGQTFVTDVRFHIVPNKVLTAGDLVTLPVAAVLPTMERGEYLMVTTAGGGGDPVRINYVRIKAFDVLRNAKIVVHGLYVPFPHLAVTAYGGMNERLELAPTAQIESAAEMEDHHGL